VFIVGMPRSGTSLVEQIIDCHPRAHGAGELSAIRQMVVNMYHRLKTDRFFPDYLDMVDADLLTEFGGAHLRELLSLAPGAARIVDKAPGNFVNLGLIAQLYPRARVINCQRDPRDSCLSCYFKSFTFGLQFSNSLESLGRYYNDYERLMAHWHTALDLPILDVQYEDTVKDVETAARRIIDFLGLPWDDACLRFHESDRQVNTASYEQVRQPIYDSSVGRYRPYEAHLKPLLDILNQRDGATTT
ncbi:MAG: sulfotransferase, partial [Phycisphaerales bacterium]|nr:sulfotransferase [Phycisphaerales bacterium]